MNTFIVYLVIMSYRGGAVSIPFHSMESCQSQAKIIDDEYRKTAICIQSDIPFQDFSKIKD